MKKLLSHDAIAVALSALVAFAVVAPTGAKTIPLHHGGDEGVGEDGAKDKKKPDSDDEKKKKKSDDEH